MDPKICVVLFFTILSETFPILRRIEQYVINVHISSCKVPILLFECELNLDFLAGFLKHHLM
jgi:hypothetical protein